MRYMPEAQRESQQSNHGSLPLERLELRSSPFTNTGVDCFRLSYVFVKYSIEKRWGQLFTCLTTHAVHFKVVSSIDTSSCVKGIEKFVFRRGVPSVFWFDNGINFIAKETGLL